MFEKVESIKELILKFIMDEVTSAEQGQLQEWIKAADSNRQLFDELTSIPSLSERLNNFDRYVKEKELVWEKIKRRIKGHSARKV